MKMIIVAFALVAVAAAAVLPGEKEVVPIVRAEFTQTPEGGYQSSFETGDGISRSETGELKEVLDEENKPHAVVVVRGQFSYTDSDGKVESVSYYADETGFHAEGDSIPKPNSRR